MGAPQEIKDLIYDATMPSRFVPIVFHWVIHKELSKKQRRHAYHPDSNTVKKLPALAHAFNDAKDYFHMWHEKLDLPVMTYYFQKTVLAHRAVSREAFIAPVWFSRRKDVLSLSELAGLTRNDIDRILGVPDGPVKLLDDNKVRVAFNRTFLGRAKPYLDGNLDPQEQKLEIHELLKRVAHRDEWIYIVGEGKVPLPRTPEAIRRFSEGQETALVEVEDQDTIDWLFECCKPFDDPANPLPIAACLRKYSESALGWPQEIQQGEISDRLERNRHRIEQAWLEANDCFHPQGPITWTEEDGPVEDVRFLADKIWDLEHPIAEEFVAKMPKIQFCIRAELYHPDQWELSPGGYGAETEKSQQSTTEEKQEPASEEVHDPWCSTLGVDVDEEGAMSRKKTSKNQMDRRQKSRKREVQKRQNGGKHDPTKEKQSRKLWRKCWERLLRRWREHAASTLFLNETEYVTRERVWKPNAPPYWAYDQDWRSLVGAANANQNAEVDVDVEWYLANAE